MASELDVRLHPRITSKRKLIGMDFSAGSVVILGVVVGIVFLGLLYGAGQLILGLIVGPSIAIGCFFFARRFINNKPSSYFTDWLSSKTNAHFIAKRFRQ